MKRPKLKKLLCTQENLKVFESLYNSLKSPFRVLDAEGNEIIRFGKKIAKNKDNILIDGDIYAILEYNSKYRTILDTLELILNKDMNIKQILNETLEKYKEINFIYNFSEKISSCLEILDIGNVVIAEASKLFNCENVTIFVLNENIQLFEILSSNVSSSGTIPTISPDKGIAGYIFRSGISEIIDDVQNDSRFIEGKSNPSSMMCVPLKTSNKTMGVITVSTHEPHSFSSGDLKLLTSLGLETAIALQNTFLQKNKIKEELIKNNLGRFVAPQVMEAILSAKGEIALSSEKRKVSLLFSDIRNFTGFCEVLKPEEIVGYLNEYFSEMVNVIFNHNGTIDKFVGDAIFALFGAPTPIENSEAKAVESAITMQITLKNMNNAWIQKNFSMGIGLNVGEVVVGNIGSVKHMDYTAIGDEVNVAARLQSIAKPYQILVSRSMYDATKNLFSYNPLGHVNVKGKKNEIEIYEVLY